MNEVDQMPTIHKKATQNEKLVTFFFLLIF